MKRIIYIALALTFGACSPKTEKTQITESTKVEAQAKEAEIIKDSDKPITENKEELIIGERIDGPANVRVEPKGEVIFELADNALIEVASEPTGDWYEILVYVDLEDDEFGLDSMAADRALLSGQDTLGRIIRSCEVSSGSAGGSVHGMLFGYTHKNNIKPETVLENAFKDQLAKGGKPIKEWTSFIKSFNLREEAFAYKDLKSYYTYENGLDDPSPGFRLVLFYQEDNLIGFIHSRDLVSSGTTTLQANNGYQLSFYEEYPLDKQQALLDYFNQWLSSVD